MKKLVSILLTLTMVLTLVPLTVFAKSGDNETITGTFTYTQGTVEFTYDDDMFANSAYEYSSDLAAKSGFLMLASAGYEEGTYADASSVAEDYLAQCGYTHFETNDIFNEKPGRDTFGIAAAYKETVIDGEEYTILALCFRGAGYEAEWASNMKVGLSGDHQGWSESSQIAYDFILDYMDRHPEITGKVKVWAASHSRGAITANMTGAKLDDLVSSGGQLSDSTTLALEDIYVYCFEPPLAVDASKTTGANAAKYNNIHNLVNRTDLVVYLFPSQMGFSRYGVDHYLPSASDEDYEAYTEATMENYDSWGEGLYYYLVKLQAREFYNVAVTPTGTVNTILSKTEGTESQKVYFLDRLSRILTEVFGGRDGYYNNYQADLYEFMGTINSALGGDTLSEFIDILAADISANASAILFDALNNREDSLLILMEDLVLDSLKKAGCSEYDAEQVNAMVKNLIPMLINLAVEYPDDTATLLVNLVSIIGNHIAEWEMAYLNVLPEDYMDKQQEELKYSPYTDVTRDSEYYDAVTYTRTKGLMVGSNTLFYADDNITKAQLCTVLWRLAGQPEANADSLAYQDISEKPMGTTEYTAVVWAVSEGIVSADSALRFGTKSSVTGEEMNAALDALGYEGTADSGTLTRGQVAEAIYALR